MLYCGVHPDYRNKGIAKQLYETFFGKVHELGCSTVRDYEGEDSIISASRKG
ncbi:GNAT family N-acetyltransferase [Paenibacillus sp. NPDC057967]|uniref:GNAT family N-acetyltransferase n=1 Tax=Paenibacillus sp. NPDC057967 TaxID=3346293 RepID=UPI0036DD6141